MDERTELLDLLRENARHSSEDLARMLGMDAAAVEEAITALEAEGTIAGYRAVVDPTNLDPEPVRAHVELNVALDRETSYSDIAERLAGFPEVESLRLMSGDYDFALEIEAESMGEVSRFVSEKVAPLPEITQTVTHYVMETYKTAGHRFEDGDEDDRLAYSP
jgi:DNA-binding Lrp family transcriptional regulator